MATLAERLRQLRRERGLTLKQLQAVSGVPFQTISRLERGATTQVGSGHLRALARALDVTTDYLLGERESRTCHGDEA